MSIAKFAVIKNTRIFSPSKILKSENKVEMTPLSVLHNNKYLYSGSYNSVFMSVFLFPLMSQFWKTITLSSFETILYAYMHLNQYHRNYYNRYNIKL